MKRKTFLAILLATMFLSSLALANDTAFGGSGSAPMPIGQSEIEMVSENIVMSGVDIGNERGEGRWDVSCDFTFKNTTDESIELDVGFPFPVNDEEGAVSVPRGRKAGAGEPLVYDFKVSVNGKLVEAKRTKIEPNPDKGQYYKDAYIWKMKFAPGETVKVHHDYITGVTWDVMAYSWASYVLKTGSNWKGGAVGRSHLEVAPNALVIQCGEIEKQADYLRPKPKGMKVAGKGAEMRFVWDLKKFRPEDDLDLCLQTAPNYAMRQILFPVVMYGDVEEQMAKLTPEQLRTMRNTVYARYGRTFKDGKLQAHFDKQWWYVKNPAYSDSMLNDEDRRIISLIAKEEARKRTGGK